MAVQAMARVEGVRSIHPEYLLEGNASFIPPMSGSLRMAMLDKNAVQLKKFKGGKTERFPISSDKDVIKVASRLGRSIFTACTASPRALLRRWTLPPRSPSRRDWRP